MAEPKRLTRQRLEAILVAAERGLDDLAYDVHEDTGVWINESEGTVREQIKDLPDGKLRPSVYTYEDLVEMAARYRRTSEALTILYRRLYPPREEERAT